MTYHFDKNKALKLWEERLQKVEEDGNFSNDHRGTLFFSHKYSLEERVQYIKNMIHKIKYDDS